MTQKPEPPEAWLALDALQEVVIGSESDAARISAAKVLLDRFAPKEDSDARNHELAERDAAISEARGLLAEFADIKLELFHLKNKMAQTSAP